MAKYWVILFVAIAVVSGGLILINKLGQEAKIAFAAKPWIEIVSPKVSEFDEKGNLVRELTTGDELSEGSIVEGQAGSYANIYFPDGSAARIDGVTKITLDEYIFDESRERLVVRLSLITGRLWNKIFELATPDSVWEVKTATAVATVRGTAFGVEVSDGKANFIGSQNNVEVSPIDPETKQIIKEARAVITAGDILEVTKEEIQRAGREARVLALKVQKVSESAAVAAAIKQDWISKAKAADETFDRQVEDLRKAVKEKSILRREIRESIKKVREEIKTEIRQASDEGVKQLNSVKDELRSRLNDSAGRVLERVVQERLKISDESNGITGEVRPVSSVDSVSSSVVAPTIVNKILSRPSKIVLETSSDLSRRIKEGAQLIFKAVLIREDGSKELVTELAEWRVIGSIGAIGKPGVFLPRLSDDLAEVGVGIGTVAASWKDSATGESFLGISPTITVEPAIVPVFIPDGG